MWIDTNQTRKWRSDSLEARIHAAAEAEAIVQGYEDPDGEALEAVFKVMSWLYGRSAKVVKRMIMEVYGVETSEAALSGFWARFAGPYLAERMRRSSAQARELANTLSAADVQRSTMELIAQQAFELMSSPMPDPEDVVKLAKVVLLSQKQDLDERKVALLEAKAKQADLAKDVMESQLSEEDKAAKMRAIFGM
jgi:hypothetical protein